MKRIIQSFSTFAGVTLSLVITAASLAQQLPAQIVGSPTGIKKPHKIPFPPPAPEPSCEPGKSPIPLAAQDRSPFITINAIASGGGGEIQYPDASSSTCASPCQCSVALNTDLLVFIHATNPGGVENVGVTIAPPDGSPYSIERAATPDVNHCVYPSLDILGHNGAGGIGGNPILFHMNHPNSKATVLVRATNFNGQWSLYAITYFPKSVQLSSKIVAQSETC